jgi:hypothetical protein
MIRVLGFLSVLMVVMVPAARAQEPKPVPKDSVRVFIPGCTKGRVFTAGEKSVENPGAAEIAEGTHIRMNGPKKLMDEIKAHEGGKIEITGLMKKGQEGPGINLGHGVRIMPGAPVQGGMSSDPIAGQLMIDVEGWRPVAGSCPSR